MTYVIGEPCVDVKDEDVLTSALSTAFTRVTGCCTSTPTSVLTVVLASRSALSRAIYYEDDLPSKWRDFTQANAQFFSELRFTGGAAKVGKTENDPQFIASSTPGRIER